MSSVQEQKHTSLSYSKHTWFNLELSMISVEGCQILLEKARAQITEAVNRLRGVND